MANNTEYVLQTLVHVFYNKYRGLTNTISKQVNFLKTNDRMKNLCWAQQVKTFLRNL